MRICVCLVLQGIHRQIVYLNETPTGIYVALLGTGGYHSSYHIDGTNHFKDSGQSQPANQHLDDPINKITEFAWYQAEIIPLPMELGDGWKLDERSTLTLFLDGRSFVNFKFLSIETCILNRESEAVFVDWAARLHSTGVSYVHAFGMFALDHFLAHKFAVIVRPVAAHAE